MRRKKQLAWFVCIVLVLQMAIGSPLAFALSGNSPAETPVQQVQEEEPNEIPEPEEEVQPDETPEEEPVAEGEDPDPQTPPPSDSEESEPKVDEEEPQKDTDLPQQEEGAPNGNNIVAFGAEDPERQLQDVEDWMKKVQPVKEDNPSQLLKELEVRGQDDQEITDFDANIPKDATVTLRYRFELQDAQGYDVIDGDYFTFDLPESLVEISDNQTSFPVDFITEGHVIAVGDISSDGKTITVTFNGEIADNDLSDVSINFEATRKLNEQKIHDAEAETISVKIREEAEAYTLKFAPKPVPVQNPATIEKRGDHNTADNTITWTVTVTPKDTTFTDAIVVDTLGAGHTYIGGTVSNADAPDTADNKVLAFHLGQITAPKTFTYKTQIAETAWSKIEDGPEDITNSVKLYNGQATGDPIDSKTGSVRITTDWIHKVGSAQGKDAIEWTITLNHNNRTIPAGTVLTDTITDKFLTIDESSATDVTGATKKIEGNTITYTFNNDVTGPQTITFKTPIDKKYLDQQTQTSFTNTAKLIVSEIEYTASAQENVGVGTNLLTKTGTNYDPATKLITWQLKVNENGRTINDAVITDIIPAGQKFNTEYGDSGVKKESGTGNFVAEYEDATKKLTITFSGGLTPSDKPVLTFQTYVENNNHTATNASNDYFNTAELIGTSETAAKIEVSSEGKQPVVSQVITKKATGYDYNTYRIAWEIVVNRNKMPMPTAVITDTIPAGQAFVADSMLIGNDAPTTSQLAATDNAFTVTLGAINDTVTITYQTEVTDKDVFLNNKGNVTFKNNATLNTGIEGANPQPVPEASHTVNNKALEKRIVADYTEATGSITWGVHINSNQAPLNDVDLVDKLPAGLELDTESVQLFLWNQAANGTNSVGNPVPADEYSFTYDYATRIFEFRLPNCAQGYFLKFDTDVVSPGQYSNTIEFEGTATTTLNDGTSSSVNVREDNIAAWASGSNGNITIKKVDKVTKEVLSDAEFVILDYKYNPIEQLTTGASGTITSKRLKFNRTFYIRETKAPTGYQLLEDDIEVTLTKEEPQLEVPIENQKLKGAITVTITDKNGKGVPGGKYGLFPKNSDPSTPPLKETTADPDGKVTFPDVEKGEYVIREITPPPGYEPMKKDIPTKLELDETENKLKQPGIDPEDLPDDMEKKPTPRSDSSPKGSSNPNIKAPDFWKEVEKKITVTPKDGKVYVELDKKDNVTSDLLKKIKEKGSTLVVSDGEREVEIPSSAIRLEKDRLFYPVEYLFTIYDQAIPAGPAPVLPNPVTGGPWLGDVLIVTPPAVQQMPANPESPAKAEAAIAPAEAEVIPAVETHSVSLQQQPQQQTSKLLPALVVVLAAAGTICLTIFRKRIFSK